MKRMASFSKVQISWKKIKDKKINNEKKKIEDNELNYSLTVSLSFIFLFYMEVHPKEKQEINIFEAGIVFYFRIGNKLNDD